MKRVPWLLPLLFLPLGELYADPKEDLVKAVVDQCKLPKEKAEALATPGRTGTIVQFTLCISSTVDVGEGCKVTCKKQGSNIGG